MRNLEIGKLYEFTFVSGSIIGPYLCLNKQPSVKNTGNIYLLMDVTTLDRIWWPQIDIDHFDEIVELQPDSEHV